MCLDKVSKKKPAPEGIGYKVFNLRKGALFGEMAARNKVRPTGTWLNSRDYLVPKGDCFVGSIKGKYPTGWHIFKSIIAVKDWMSTISPGDYATRRIKYRRAHTEGTTYGYKVIVAKEIYIIP